MEEHKEKVVINMGQLRSKDNLSKIFHTKIALKKATIIFSQEVTKMVFGKRENYLLMEKLVFMKVILNKD